MEAQFTEAIKVLDTKAAALARSVRNAALGSIVSAGPDEILKAPAIIQVSRVVAEALLEVRMWYAAMSEKQAVFQQDCTRRACLIELNCRRSKQMPVLRCTNFVQPFREFRGSHTRREPFFGLIILQRFVVIASNECDLGRTSQNFLHYAEHDQVAVLSVIKQITSEI